MMQHRSTHRQRAVSPTMRNTGTQQCPRLPYAVPFLLSLPSQSSPFLTFRRSSTLFLLTLVIALSAFAQTGKISGRVIDQKTKDGVPGVNVVVKGTKLGAVTDPDGNYFILQVVPEQYDVTASLIGYTTVTKRGVIVNQSRTTEVNFVIEETVVALQNEVVVNAERPDVVKEKTSTSEVIRADEVLISPGVIDLSSVLTMTSDVVDGHFRGGRDGEELYTLAGMGIVNPLTSGAAFQPIMSAVEEVEVITSGFSAQYGNAQSGVVNISMKEGRADKWQGRAELRMRTPGYKHFGANVFDAKSNPYLQILGSPEGWKGVDLSAGGTAGSVYFSGLGGSFASRFKDTLQASQIAYQLWKQARRDVNTKYNDLVDYSADFNIGGPVTKDVRLFLASFVQNEWLLIPTSEPDVKRQVLGNIVYDMGEGMTLRLSGGFTNKKEHLLPGLNSFSYTSFQRWLWDREIGLARTNENDLQLGVRFAHALSNATFYEIKINSVRTDYSDGVRVADPNRFVTDDQNVAVWPYYNVQDKFSTGQMDNDFRSEKTSTVTIDGSLTSQVTQSHMILAGVQANLYSINVNNRTGLSSAGSEQDEIYAAKPFEFGLFVQDKMEFEGLIANVGLRLDLFNPNDEYSPDYYSPVATGTTSAKVKTPTLGRLQPRVGISFPVSVNTVFHLNYGTFVQRPSFNRILFSQVRPNDGRVLQLGNPNLKPEYTQSYDVGLTQALGDGFTLDVSGYYKDVKNLVQQAIFTVKPADGGYRTFVNRDYADIRGFHATLTNRRGIFTGKASYTYSVATGSNSTPFNSVPRFILQPDPNTPSAELPSAKDVTLDFDRTHNLVITLAASTPEDWGPEIFDAFPFEGTTISLKSFARSGRPYTSNLDHGLVNQHRTPSEYSTDLKFSRKVNKLFGNSTTFYVEVFNLFNQRIYSYNTVFQSASTTGSSSSIANNNADIYDRNPAQLQYFTAYAPFLVDQTFLLYANRPTEVYVGMTINF